MKGCHAERRKAASLWWRPSITCVLVTWRNVTRDQTRDEIFQPSSSLTNKARRVVSTFELQWVNPSQVFVAGRWSLRWATRFVVMTYTDRIKVSSRSLWPHHQYSCGYSTPRLSIKYSPRSAPTHLLSFYLHTHWTCRPTWIRLWLVDLTAVHVSALDQLSTTRTAQYYYYYYYYFISHEHKAAGVKIEAKQIKKWLQRRLVWWKETAFPLWKAMDRRWKNVMSSVIVVMRLPISCVTDIIIIIIIIIIRPNRSNS